MGNRHSVAMNILSTSTTLRKKRVFINVGNTFLLLALFVFDFYNSTLDNGSRTYVVKTQNLI